MHRQDAPLRHRLHQRRDHGAQHQDPHRAVEEGRADHRDDGGDLRHEIDADEPAERDLALQGVDLDRRERGDQQRQAGHRQQPRELRLLVEVRGRLTQQAAHQHQHRAAHDLHRPRGVQEALVLRLLAAHHARAQADVREHRQADQQHGDDGHQAEVFRRQQARQRQVAGQAQHLRPGEAQRRPGEAAQQQRLQRATLEAAEQPGCAHPASRGVLTQPARLRNQAAVWRSTFIAM